MSFELTIRDVEMISMISHGKTSREIAASLGLSHRTVEERILRLCRVYGYVCRTQLACEAIRQKLID